MGDPILSKWIVVVLAISITLNGYLLKGIAAGVVGGMLAESLGVGLGGMKGAVRFEEAEGDGEGEIPLVVIAPETDVQIPLSPEVTTNLASFKMEELDKKLRTAERLILPDPSPTITTTTPSPSNESSTCVPPSPSNLASTRTLDECVDIFENGPRPLSKSLALLNDEEVIMLAQAGKIAAYALEKVLGSDELERAVRIRRALICTSFLRCWISNTD